MLEKEKLVRNFNRCANWEEKYLYLIELGEKLVELPDSFRRKEHSIYGCQSQVWIIMEHASDNTVQLYGDSDAAIVKGLIATVFSLYSGMTPLQVVELNVHPWLEQLELTRYLTPSRSHGLEAMIRTIRARAKALC